MLIYHALSRYQTKGIGQLVNTEAYLQLKLILKLFFGYKSSEEVMD